ncbi:DUF4097 family beta strand repeat-containing protein [Microbacterium amylolyticum]|uniref:DUF4097 domain-containing protein n=1 Tax=Microbacterium amylolyticum TaxID=936337 RepID=A0ABS4ZIW1_9MICO|nr:DUF4097 family beta strand repeat-containing protein [Microbacterium amylolyticum]MBP2436426.1 hypothetical protein [Microbacterium amylolyticum]
MEEKWIIHPGEARVIDVMDVTRLKAALAAGQIDVIGHDEPHIRVEVHSVAMKPLRIEVSGDELEIDHPQVRWDSFLTAFRSFGSSGPRAEVSVALPRHIALTLGVVSASALVAGLEQNVTINAVSGDVLVDGLVGDLNTHAVSGDVQVRGLTGAFSSDMVSGDIAVSGEITKTDVNTVSGAVFIDAAGRISQVSLNTVSGAATLRLDDDYPANYSVRSVGGRVQIDGVSRARTYSGHTGALSGMFAEVRVNTVSGDVTVLRHGAHAPTSDYDHQASWPGQEES